MKKYFLGLDIGTDSVGWAVTDTDYQIVKKNGKALWGVRLFDSAQSAAERRGYRIARRRIERRRQRLDWLQNVFAEAIGAVDPGFFERLHESKFLEEDKEGSLPLGKYTLFADKNYCDKDYHREYPTIYHLRKTLIEKPGPFDVRLVYLAVHHILKNRGHFLYGDLAMDAVSLKTGLERLNVAMDQEIGRTLQIDDEQGLKEVLISREKSRTEKKKELAKILSLSKENGPVYAVMELLAGSKVSLNALYGEEVATDEISKVELDSLDENEEKLMNALGDRVELILAVKEIYDWALLENMREGNRYLSFAKVKTYEKHGKDLEKLKKTIRKLDSDLYREMFHVSKKDLDNYVAYSGKGAKNDKCDYAAFQKYLTGKLKVHAHDPAVHDMLKELELGTFLPRQTSKRNGVIPHQLHGEELEAILRNAENYLPFLKETDESGLTKSQQIQQMFYFRIPYYVGPLNARSDHGWIVRNDGKIYPWNFSEKVDLEQCRDRFITRMTAKCSYLGENVLPKASLLYSKFMVLNEINNLKVNGEPISVAQKQAIYRDLFLKKKKVTQANIRIYLGLDKEDELSGIDKDIKSDLAPWRYYARLLERADGFDMVEEIIRYITLFGEDKRLLKSWLKKTYGSVLNEEDQEYALRFRCSGWGRLSKEFLTGIYHADENGEAHSIIDMLWETNDNLMELLSSRYNFGRAVEEYRAANLSKQGFSLKEYLAESYASPAIKRSIHQVMGIVDEIAKIMRCSPEKVFVEMARDTAQNGKKGKRTVSRKAELIALYEKCDEDSGPIFESLTDQPEGALRRDKLYLFYTQLGKCMYSGESIPFARLDSDYDIDHIYPQSKIKDDSIHNRVLVRKDLNNEKQDKLLSADVRKKMRPVWTELLRKELISKEKYDRLTRTKDFSEAELAGFIARQLVETRQSSKIVAELLQNRFGDQTEVVYVKAGNVSSFRDDQKITDAGVQKQASQCKNEHTVQDPLFVKCREINDFHHAKDAYLNIVVGNVYHVKFTRNPLNFFKEKHTQYSLNRMFDFDVTRGEDCAWTAGPEGSIATVRRMMRKNNILFTRRPSEVKGGFYDQLLVPKGKGQAVIKSADPRMSIEKYGGYNKVTGTYFFLVEHTNKKKRIRSLETVFLMHLAFYEKDPLGYCREILGLVEPKILIPKIRFNSLLSLDGFRMHISSRTGSNIRLKNANQLILAPEWHQYVKFVSKYLERCKSAKRTLEITAFDHLSEEQNLKLYLLLEEKLGNSLYGIKQKTAAQHLEKNLEKFRNLELSEQCGILINILSIFANTADGADLKQIGAPANTGLLGLSQNLTNAEGHKLSLIHQSITGFFEQEVDLLAEDLS